jgi:hypothetical protein
VNRTRSYKQSSRPPYPHMAYCASRKKNCSKGGVQNSIFVRRRRVDLGVESCSNEPQSPATVRTADQQNEALMRRDSDGIVRRR